MLYAIHASPCPLPFFSSSCSAGLCLCLHLRLPPPVIRTLLMTLLADMDNTSKVIQTHTRTHHSESECKDCHQRTLTLQCQKQGLKCHRDSLPCPPCRAYPSFSPSCPVTVPSLRLLQALETSPPSARAAATTVSAHTRVGLFPASSN